jgi:hypothetical protein
MSSHQAYRTLLTASVAGVVASCDLSTRELAEENTSYSSGLLKSGPSSLTDIRADMSVKEVFDRIGTPLWVSDLTSGKKEQAFFLPPRCGNTARRDL